MFLEDNLHHVREESARGKGLHLEALSQVAGCSISHSDFGKIIKKITRKYLIQKIQVQQKAQFMKLNKPRNELFP